MNAGTDKTTLTEAEGVAILLRVFSEAGLSLQTDYRMVVEGHVVTLDGYDEAFGVGFEYITDEAGDRAEFSPEAIVVLERKMRDGALYVFLVDEHEGLTEPELAFAAEGFLAVLRDRGVLP